MRWSVPSSRRAVCIGFLHFLLLLPVLLPSSSLTSARVSPRLDAPLCSTTARVKATGAVSVVGSANADLTVQLDSWGNDSIRIRVSPADIQQIPYVQALLPFAPGLTPPSDVSPCHVPRRRKLEEGADMTNGNLQVTVSTDGQLTIKRMSDGATLVQSTAISFTPLQLDTVYVQNYSLYALSLDYTHANGKVFGLGEHKTNRTAYDDYSHLFERSQQYGYSSGGDISIPFYVSTAGFGLLYNQAGYGFLHITRDQAQWRSNATHQLDLWVTTSPAKSSDVTPYPAISSNYADATGHPNPIPPLRLGLLAEQRQVRSQRTST